MRATERFSLAVNPEARAKDGSDRLIYSHMVYLTREDEQMDKNELLKAIMKHAVAGHDSTEGSTPGIQGGYNRYCNDPQHALDILAANHHTIRPTFSKSDFRLVEDGVEDYYPAPAHSGRSDRFA